ncbi:MAG: hypothetical protein VR75_16870 [Hyphomonadaceae bacterium BRH_c29]|nr:MAG: hypothetical protein VR75_16870 [Hyphomonadaceae bacterium BRH_c29]
MDRKLLAAPPSIRDEGIVTEIFHLRPHIMLARNVHAGVEIGNFLEMIFVSVREIGYGLQPVIDQPASLRVQRSPHAATTVVSADNDVAHLQHLYGKLQHGEKIHVTRGRKVRDITMHEQFARVETNNFVSRHTAVAASDPEIFGRLLGRQPTEEIGLSAHARTRPLHVVFQ